MAAAPLPNPIHAKRQAAAAARKEREQEMINLFSEDDETKRLQTPRNVPREPSPSLNIVEQASELFQGNSSSGIQVSGQQDNSESLNIEVIEPATPVKENL